MTIRQLIGDARVQLATLEPESAQVVITSPPYYGLRDYGTEPLVWGGDPNCNAALRLAMNGAAAIECVHGFDACPVCDNGHTWGTEVRAPWANELPSAKSVTTRNNAFHESMGKTAGSFCPCGAWLGSLGLEPTPDLFIEHLVEVFCGVRRVLRPDGLLWVNLGDSYAGSGKGPSNSLNKSNPHSHEAGVAMKRGLNNLQDTPTQRMPLQRVGPQEHTIGQGRVPDMKPKDLLMMPSRLAIALQADGWWLRSMIPWLKRNCMPESCNDRPTSAIEYWFLFSRSRTYYWDADAVRSRSAPSSVERAQYNGREPNPKNIAGVASGVWKAPLSTAKAYGQGRNRRNADWFIESWQGLLADDDGEPLAFVVNPTPFKGSHFATFPPKLVEPMIRASTHPGDTVLDPFGGAGTVGLVADRLGRNAILIDLKPGYADMAHERLVSDAPMFVEMTGGGMGASAEPVKDKQGALGKRTYSGFNARWDAKEAGA